MNSCTERVLLVAESRIAATAIKSTLQQASCTQVIGYVKSRRSCSAVIGELLPDVVIVLEAREPEDVLARVRDARGAAVNAKIIVVTDSMEPLWLARLTEAGADAAIRKRPDAISVGALVREIIRGNVASLHSPVARQDGGHGQATAAGLTSREREILVLVAQGEQNGEIARRLWITEQTVKFHLSNVYRKLGVANRTQASHVAYMDGIVDVSDTTPRRLTSAA
jgi:DNA-binding NarL/FixJ family response regulator